MPGPRLFFALHRLCPSDWRSPPIYPTWYTSTLPPSFPPSVRPPVPPALPPCLPPFPCHSCLWRGIFNLALPPSCPRRERSVPSLASAAQAPLNGACTGYGNESREGLSGLGGTVPTLSISWNPHPYVRFWCWVLVNLGSPFI